jgi:hypothetical protein
MQDLNISFNHRLSKRKISSEPTSFHDKIQFIKNYASHLWKRLRLNESILEPSDLSEFEFKEKPYWLRCLSEQSARELVTNPDSIYIKSFINIFMINDLTNIVMDYLAIPDINPTIHTGQVLRFNRCDCSEIITNSFNHHAFYPYQLLYINSHDWNCTISRIVFDPKWKKFLMKVKEWKWGYFEPLNLHNCSLQGYQKAGCRLIGGIMMTNLDACS